MPSWSLSDLALDPDLGEALTIVRSTGSFAAGGFQSSTVSLDWWGILAVAEDEILRQFSEGDRITGDLILFSADPLYETSEQRSGLSDQVAWNQGLYRIVKVGPWKDWGFYAAVLTRIGDYTPPLPTFDEQPGTFDFQQGTFDEAGMPSYDEHAGYHDQAEGTFDEAQDEN